MGALSQLLHRANPANAANRRTAAGLDSQNSHDSQANGTDNAACHSHDSQDSHAQALRASLRRAAIAEGLPADLADGLDTADVRACAGLSHDVLRAYLRALVRSQHMAAGNVPEAWTRAADCAGCGPVLLWPGVPESVPGCPWCQHRKAGRAIPRPRGD